MWEIIKTLLGFSVTDVYTLCLCVFFGLVGALAHITIQILKSHEDNKGHQHSTRLQLTGYGFVGAIIGLCIGVLAAGILKETATAVRTVCFLATLAGWQAHRFFRRGVFDVA